MSTFLVIFLLLLAVLLGGAVLRVFLTSPEGYEDEHGFHYGRDPQPRS